MGTIQKVSTEIPLRKVILDAVNRNSGIKGVELVLSVMGQLGPVTFSNEEYFQTLTELISDGDILELEYKVPATDYRLKSIYFPKGTRVNVTPQIKLIVDGSDTILPCL